MNFYGLNPLFVDLQTNIAATVATESETYASIEMDVRARAIQQFNESHFVIRFYAFNNTKSSMSNSFFSHTHITQYIFIHWLNAIILIFRINYEKNAKIRFNL